MKLSGRYLAAMASVLALAALFVLTWLGVPPFDNVGVFILTNVVAFFAILVLGVLGGAFIGLILAQRILVPRDFSPYERQVLESLDEIKSRLAALEKRVEGEPPARR